MVGVGADVQSGSIGINLGGVTGIGVDTILLDINVSKAIPEPTSLAVLGMLGVGLVTRRRR